MNKNLTKLSCIWLALCLVLCGTLPATAAEESVPDTTAPVISHSPVQYARYGEALSIAATVTDDTAVSAVRLYYRSIGESQWTQLDMTAGDNGTYSAQLPADQVSTSVLQYYLEASDGSNVSMYGSSDKPLPVMVNKGLYIHSVDPAQVDISAVKDGITATITGENFSEGMSVILGETEIPEYQYISDTQISLVLPQMPTVCLNDLQITKDDSHAILLNAVTYKDSSSFVKLTAPENVFVGQNISLPVSISAAGDVTDLELGIQLDPVFFENMEFVQSDANPMAVASCSVSKDGLVSIRISSADYLDKSAAVGYLTATVQYTQEQVSSTIQFVTAKFQGVNVDPVDCPVNIRNDISIELLNVPESVTTLEGVLPDCSGWQVSIRYPGLEQKDTVSVSADMLTMTKEDPDHCTVSYMGQSISFACTQITKDLIDRLEITVPPDKTVYIYGEALDLSGMQVSLVYQDTGIPALPITNYTVEGYDPNTVGIQSVTVRCGDFSAAFDVTVNPKEISSEIFTIADGYLRGLAVGSTPLTLTEGLNDSQYIRIFKGETEVDMEDNLATGMTVKLMNGDTVLDSLTLIVTGDVNGDGKISILDMVSIKSHTLDIQTLSDAAALAADYNSDGKLSILDYVQVKAMLLGLDINESL